MDETAVTPANELASKIASLWWVPLLRGIALLVVGVWALLNPGMTMIVFTQILGAFLIIDGFLSVIAALMGRTESRGWSILRGVLLVLIGGFVFVHPMIMGVIAVTIIAIIIAISAITGGVLEILIAISERKKIKGEGWMIAEGVLHIIFGLIVAMMPLLSSLIFIRVLGIAAIVFSFVLITLALKLRRLGSSAAA